MAEQRDPVRVEEGGKRVRVFHDGEAIADTTEVRLVWEVPYYPTYYFPADYVRTDLLVATGDSLEKPWGHAEIHDVKGARTRADRAVFRHGGFPALEGLFSFRWRAFEWFEEDEQVYVHPRDPHTRIDILPSSRHVEVVVDGIVVADTRSARFLFETGLPTRYYIPKTDIRMDLLVPTDHHTECPYKGTASYYSVDTGRNVHANLAWWYPAPVRESVRIAGLVAFYNEKADLRVDDEPLARPTTPFS